MMVRLPNGQEITTKYWINVLIETTQWLHQTGVLTSENCRMSMSDVMQTKAYLLSPDGQHMERAFRNPMKIAEGIFLDVQSFFKRYSPSYTTPAQAIQPRPDCGIVEVCTVGTPAPFVPTRRSGRAAPHLWIPACAGMTLGGVGDAAMVRGGVSPPCDRSYFDFPQHERSLPAPTYPATSAPRATLTMRPPRQYGGARVCAFWVVGMPLLPRTSGFLPSQE